jgi:hypothetical protein
MMSNQSRWTRPFRIEWRVLMWRFWDNETAHLTAEKVKANE